ncbi:TetR/AcrR family transcriptional regulator [Paraburkholderia agricolaris]|uniref:TetR/AcrR family transcriptional regulator n=1 Tax=Paraburkholderia agricolaris TaxID=2152888 RepID=UPI0012928BCF|nr:TetR/AcrR family transcriptional regulator [Paraburkholderia agricolaris]
MSDTLDVTTKQTKHRRSQADRSAESRARIIAAARDVLCAQGYSGATMYTIRDAAGMSLGAIQHQFPTKANVMAALTAEISASVARTFAEAIRRGRTPKESMENLLDANFDRLNRPEMAALLEISLARRNDPELDREVTPSVRRFDRRVRSWIYRILRAAGVDFDETQQQCLQMLNNSMTRGLTVEFIQNPDNPVIERCVRIWKAQILDMCFGGTDRLDEKLS